MTIFNFLCLKKISKANKISLIWFLFDFFTNPLCIRCEQNSLHCWLVYRLTLANHFADSVLYFPHNIDFRGRAYPISPQINHMGDDLNRGLLKFAKGKRWKCIVSFAHRVF